MHDNPDTWPPDVTSTIDDLSAPDVALVTGEAVGRDLMALVDDALEQSGTSWDDVRVLTLRLGPHDDAISTWEVLVERSRPTDRTG